jgi:hypothetical protein
VSFVLFGKRETTNAKKRKENKRNGKQNKQNQQSSLERRRRRTKWSVPHCFVEFGYFGFQIGTLVGQKSELADVAGLVALRIIISQFGCTVEYKKNRKI